MNTPVGCLIAVAAAAVAAGCGGTTRTGTRTTKPTPTETSRHAPNTHADVARSGTVHIAPETATGSVAAHREPLPAFVAGTWNGIKPAEIDFSADSSNVVTGIRWSSWTSAHALGRGSSLIESCEPDCASGAVTHVGATIALSRPVGGHFTRVSEVRAGRSVTAFYRSGRWPLGAR